MEASKNSNWQKDYVISCHQQLVDATRWNRELQNRLEELGGPAIENIQNSEGNGESQVSCLYKAITTPESYATLAKVLCESLQQVAAKILFDGYRKNNVTNPLDVCQLNIDYNRILTSDIVFNWRLKAISDIFGNLEKSFLIEKLSRTQIDYEYIDIFLTRHKQFCLSEGAIPKVPSSCCISPVLVQNLALNPDIFKTQCADIFVFVHWDTNKLKSLVNPNNVSTCTRNIYLPPKQDEHSEPTRFYMLNSITDWKDISRYYSGPVHLIGVDIDRKSNNFRLLDSKGKSVVIGNFLRENKTIHFRDNTLNEILSENVAFTIINTTGERDSYFFASFAHNVQKLNREDITLYINLPVFILSLNEYQMQLDMDFDTAFKAVIDYVTISSPISKVLLQATKEITDRKFNFFFESLDQVLCGSYEWTKKFLNSLAGFSRERVRVFVSSKPIFRHELEPFKLKCYHVLGYCEFNTCIFLLHSATKINSQSGHMKKDQIGDENSPNNFQSLHKQDSHELDVDSSDEYEETSEDEDDGKQLFDLIRKEGAEEEFKSHLRAFEYDWKDIKDANGNPLLHVACEVGNTDITEFLINEGADIEKRNSCEETAFLYTVKCTSDEKVKKTLECLVKHGANVNALDIHGNNAVFLAVLFGKSVDIIEFIVSLECNSSNENLRGQKIFEILRESKRTENEKEKLQEYFIMLA